MQINGLNQAGLFSTSTKPAGSAATASNVTSTAGSGASNAASDYDFTDMSPQQLQSAINDMIKSGRMTVDNSSALVVMVPTALSKVNYDGQPPASYTQPTNLLNTLQQGIVGANSRGDQQNAATLTAALHLLQSLQGTAKRIDTRA